MNCSSCGRIGTAEDKFCRRCGKPFQSSRLPAVYRRPGLPTIVEQALPKVGQGLAVLAVSAGLAALQRKATGKSLLPWKKSSHQANFIQLAETIIVRRWIVSPKES